MGRIPHSQRTVCSIGEQVSEHGSLAKVPAEAVANVRNDRYLTSEAIRFLDQSAAVTLPAAVLLSGSLYWAFSHLF